MGASAIRDSVATSHQFARLLQSVVELPSKTPKFCTFPAALDPRVARALEYAGIHQLYSHQAASIGASLGGADVMVTTGTGSGKSLCYVVPALQNAVIEPAARAMLLFPTKALAQDQEGKLRAYQSLGLRAACYDGDTPLRKRAPIRKGANLILTNPDMLHVGLMPQHELWGPFFRSLRLIAVDEAHAYRGVFGSNVALILTRLLRICDWYGSRPQIVATSATLRDPALHFERLTGRKATVIDDDGGPVGDRLLMFFSAADPEEAEDFSANVAAGNLLADLVRKGVRTMAFCRSRIATEIVLNVCRRELSRGGGDGAKVDSYRGGYTQEERRKIESDLFEGRLIGLATTNAMELGVDVGDLEAVVMNGFPPGPSSFWQQSGRAGRGGKPGMAFAIAQADPLENLQAKRPEFILEAKLEPLVVTRENPHILRRHLLCASYERPLVESDVSAFGDSAAGIVRELVDAGELHESAGRLFFPGHRSPAARFNIRGAGDESVTLRCGERALGTMEKWRAIQNAHPGAIYLHRGESFRCERADWTKGEVQVTPVEPDYFTKPVVQSTVEVRVGLQEDQGKAVRIELDALHVTQAVLAYRMIPLHKGMAEQRVPIEAPIQEMDTLGVQIAFPDLESLGEEGDGVSPAVHACEHALMSVAPAIAGCDRMDLGSSWYALHADSHLPAVFVYDTVPGGVGLAEELFANRQRWLQAALDVLQACPCEFGCPLCLLSPYCESANDLLDKAQAIGLLRAALTL